MAAKILAKDRESLRQADDRFPGGRIQGITIPSMRGQLEKVREGSEEASSIPWLLPANAKILKKRLELRKAETFDRSNPDHVNELSSMTAEASRNPEAWNELASYRTFELTNDVMASPFAMGAFQTVNLSADELPLIERPRSRNMQRFTVRSASLDGGTLSQQWRTTKSAEQIDMEMLNTDRVEYPLWDLQQGDVSAADAVNRELAYDMEMKFDTLARANIDAAQAANGLRALLSIHPSVVQANIPDKNYLDLTNVGTYGPANILTLERIKAILNHIALFGAADPTQALTIQTMLLSPQNMRDPWDYVDLVSGWDSSGSFGKANPVNTVPTSVREQIFSSGMITSAWGMSWSWTPNSQIAKGKLYVFTNQPLGWAFTKSEFDRIVKYDDTNSPRHAENNIGEVFYQKTIRFYVPDLWKYRIVIVDF